MHVYLKTVNCLVSGIDLTSEYDCMLMDLNKNIYTYKYIYIQHNSFRGKIILSGSSKLNGLFGFSVMELHPLVECSTIL